MTMTRALAAGAFVLGIAAINAAPANASTVTDNITFTDTGSYGVGGSSWNGDATATVSFNITFDPTQLYLTQSIAGFISDLTFTVTDDRFSPATLTLDPITSFAYDGSGTLTLYSDSSLGKNLNGTPNITIGVNGWAYPPESSVWYSQTDFDDTLTTNGNVTITPVGPTPLPPAFSMMLIGLAGFGFFAYRAKKGSTKLDSGTAFAAG